MRTLTTTRRTVVVHRATTLFARITAALLIAAPWLVPPLAVALGLAAGALFLAGGGAEEFALAAAPDTITAATDADCVMLCAPPTPAAPPVAPVPPATTGTDCVMFCATGTAEPSPMFSAAAALVTGFGAL